MPEIIANNDAHYAYEIVKTICTEVVPGLPGSPQERERAVIIKGELESHLGAGNVAVEEFTVAPGALLGAQRLSALFMLVAVLLNLSMGRFTGVSPWLTAVAALAFSIFSVLTYLLEFIFGFEMVDLFFKKKRSASVIGALRKPGTKNEKRLLILDELKRLDARLLNFEMVAHPEIGILTSDLTGTVMNSPEMVRSVVAAAERAGVPYKVSPAYLGVGTDAGPFSKAGLKATTLLPFKVPQQLVAFYHQNWDGPEILTIEPLSNVLELTLEWVCNGGEP